MKIDIDSMYTDRIEQIEKDLRKEYYKGAIKDKCKIAVLLQEKKRLLSYIGDEKK